jgi:hypothetical protein
LSSSAPRARTADAKLIRHALATLGRRFTRPARLFLVGDTSLVSGGLIPDTDRITLTYDVTRAHLGPFLRELARIAQELPVDVVESSPAEVIPLPAGAAGRARRYSRFGLIDVQHFDPYSTALVALRRDDAAGVKAVRRLLAAEWITLPLLIAFRDEIRPRLESPDAAEAIDRGLATVSGAHVVDTADDGPALAQDDSE